MERHQPSLTRVLRVGPPSRSRRGTSTCAALAGLAAGVLIVTGVGAPADATVLTFDVFTNPAKTTWVGNAVHSIQSYGDNVSNFSPAGPSSEGYYYNYGSAGGPTPDVTVQYRYHNPGNPLDNGLTSVVNWDTGFGDLTNTIFNAQPSPWFLELRFTPAAGKRVRLDSFDLAGYVIDRTVPTIQVVQDLTTATPVSLWGPLTNTTISGTLHNHFTPNVTVFAGHTLSLIFGADVGGVRGLDNVLFSQGEVPEPGSCVALGLTALALLSRSGLGKQARR